MVLHLAHRSNPKASDEAARSGEVWTCSMHPQVRLPRPGSYPVCGM
ncbi:MAG: hypothetical protein NTV29_05585 [Planctomycetota bacterium]|nr:hypothetical protein [Planctomycetota bacterium]